MMHDDDMVLDLIEQLYDAALVPARWPAFLGAMHDALGGAVPLLVTRLPYRHDRKYATALGLEASFVRTYCERYFACDPWAPRLAGLPQGAVRFGQELVPGAALVRTEFYHEWMRPQGFVPSPTLGGIILREGERLLSTLSMFRPRSSRALEDDEDLQLVQRLMPHLARAVRIQQELVHLTRRAARATALPARRAEGRNSGFAGAQIRH